MDRQDNDAADAQMVATYDQSPLLPGWVLKLGAVLSWIVLMAGVLGTLASVRSIYPQHAIPDVFVTLGTLVAMAFLVVLIHEGGHAFCAHRAGMRVVAMQAGWLGIKPRVGGFSWRLHRPKGGLGGFVVAFPDPQLPVRPAMVRMTLGGPLANLVVATIAVIPAVLLPRMAAAPLFAGFAFLNACVAVGNLLPRGGNYMSDGLALIGYWRRRDDAPELAYVRLMGLSLFGTPAERLPLPLLQQLRWYGPGMQLVVAWFWLKASQNLGDWKQAQQVEAEVAAIVAPLPPAYLSAFNELLVWLRLEIAFSRAMHDRCAEPLAALRLGKAIDWHAPHLRPRFAALQAALAGDVAAMEQHLQEVRRQAEASLDISLRESEVRMMDAIRGVVDEVAAVV